MTQRQQRRHDSILQLLSNWETLQVSEICNRLDASPATVRRDLERLEQEGLVIRTHGGAMLRQQALFKPPYMDRLLRNEPEKMAVARAAVGLIRNHETIFLAGGTTTYHMARVLAETDQEVVVVTNALDIAMELSRNARLRLLVLGGEIGDSYTIGGHWAELMLHKLPLADRLFMGVDGVEREHGVTTYRPLDAEIHREMAGRAREVVVLTDRTKFGVVRFCPIMPLKQVNTLITDAGLAPELVKEYEHMTNLILAPI